MNIILEFWRFMKHRKKYWLYPVVLILLVFGGLIVLANGSVIAPFIYTLF
jgi:hypothetical protein